MKYSLAVKDRSKIVCTIQASDIDFIDNWKKVRHLEGFANIEDGYVQVNQYRLERDFSGKALQVLSIINECLNLNNYDNSDPMIDYFDVGHYVAIQIGKWDKPFNYLNEERKVEAEASLSQIETKF